MLHLIVMFNWSLYCKTLQMYTNYIQLYLIILEVLKFKNKISNVFRASDVDEQYSSVG